MSRIFLILSVLFVFFVPAYAADPAAEPKPPAPASPVETSIPLDQPGADDAAVKSWSALAVADFMTYSYQDYEHRLQQSADYFTKFGWQNFVEALKKSRTLDSVVAQEQTSTARIKGPPVMVQKGVLNGKYRWVVTMPLVITYKSAQSTRIDALRVNLVIERTPVNDTFAGLGIAQFIATIDTEAADASDAADYHPPGRLMASVVKDIAATGPLDKPGLDSDALLAWAAVAATRAGTFGFHDYEEKFGATPNDFTPDAWKAYYGQIVNSGVLKTVVENQQIVTAAPATKPVIAHEEAKDGVYRWDVGMTLVRTFRAGNRKSTTRVPLLLTVTRTTQAPGLAISSWAEGK